MEKLENRVEIIVPKHDNEGREIDSQFITTRLNNITRACGGLTTTDIKGQWYSEDEQRIMEDNNTNYEWYYPTDKKTSISISLKGIIQMLIGAYDQEAISLKINGTLYLIFKDDVTNILQHKIKDLL